MYKLYINLIDLHFDYAHAEIHTHTQDGGRGYLLDQPHPSSSPTTLRLAIVSSVYSSQGESYSFHGAGQTSSGGYGSQARGSQGSGSREIEFTSSL